VPHRADSQGEIVSYEFSGPIDYLCGDATKAYGGRAEQALRHVVFLRCQALQASQQRAARITPTSDLPDAAIVLCDQLATQEPTTFQFMLHAFSPFQIDEGAARLRVERPQAGLIAQYLAPGELSFRQWDGYDPPPREKFPNQWHVEASTKEPRARIDMITVLVPHRAGRVPELSVSRVETDQVVGAEGKLAGIPFRVIFLKDGVEPPVQFEGQKLEKRFGIWWGHLPAKR
jgi:hypothetical protein